MPVLTLIFVIFIIWLQYEMRKASRLDKKAKDRFWDKENSSNLSRRKDIAGLDYFTIKTDGLPLEDKTDETINSYRDTVLKLNDKKIINLSGYSNTELKIMYGPANLKLLTEYENNFITLVSILQKWAERLYSGGYIEDAASVLEYGVLVKSDVSGTYKLLAQIYKLNNNPGKIGGLIDSLSEVKIHDKDKLIESLKEFNQYS